MAIFERKWAHWGEMGEGKKTRNQPETHNHGTAKTDKRAFGGFGGPLDAVLGVDLEALSVAAFASAGLILEVDSSVLGGRILLASDNTPGELTEDWEPHVFRGSDLWNLVPLRAPCGHRCTVADLLTIFGGTLQTATLASEGRST